MEYNFPDSPMTVTGSRLSNTLVGHTMVSYGEIQSKNLKNVF